jgi:hypothetical protein
MDDREISPEFQLLINRELGKFKDTLLREILEAREYASAEAEKAYKKAISVLSGIAVILTLILTVIGLLKFDDVIEKKVTKAVNDIGGEEISEKLKNIREIHRKANDLKGTIEEIKNKYSDEINKFNQQAKTAQKTANDSLKKLSNLKLNKWCDCYDADWVGSFDRKGWNLCKDGFFLVGLNRNKVNCPAPDLLGCIEYAKCCQPCN